jgi:hypothetical protein
MRIPENAVLQGPPQGPEPIRTDNFRPATITVTDNGSIKPPSMLPVFFGAGLAMLIILNSGRGSLFTLNFR